MRTRTAGTKGRVAPPRALPRLRAPLVFAIMLLLFVTLLGRALYLQWIDNQFLQERRFGECCLEAGNRVAGGLQYPAHAGQTAGTSVRSSSSWTTLALPRRGAGAS